MAPEQDNAPIQIAEKALEKWNALPDGAPLELALTKADIDNLLLGLRSVIISQSHLVNALSAHTNQDMTQCVERLMSANQLCLTSFNKLNLFISAVMDGAAPKNDARS